MSTQNEQVVVIGAGYAGLSAATRAARGHRVTLIAPEERFVNRVRLHEVAAGRKEHQPRIAQVLRGRNVTHIRARVTELDLAGRKVFYDDGTGEGSAVAYDTLVYALGSHTAWHHVPGAAEHAYAVERAEELRDRLRQPDDTPVAVVGGGATGIELAAEIAEAHPGRKVAIVAANEVGGWFSAKGRAIVHANLTRLGVSVHEHSEVTAVDETGLTTANGRIDAGIVVWAASFEVGTLAQESGLAVNERGEALVDEYLRSVSHPDVYVAGDAAAVTLPGIGRLRKGCVSAQPMGKYVGKTLARGSAKPFTFGYVIQCLSLGRDAGLVQRVAKNDSMIESAYGGRVGKLVKAGIVWGVVSTLR